MKKGNNVREVSCSIAAWETLFPGDQPGPVKATP